LETTKNKITLADLPVGSRLLYRSKLNWRNAVVSRVSDDKVTLIVSSPSGFSYRLRRDLEAEIFIDGNTPILENRNENWRENFAKYDYRW
jgi:hypothetical protein